MRRRSCPGSLLDKQLLQKQTHRLRAELTSPGPTPLEMGYWEVTQKGGIKIGGSQFLVLLSFRVTANGLLD